MSELLTVDTMITHFFGYSDDYEHFFPMDSDDCYDDDQNLISLINKTIAERKNVDIKPYVMIEDKEEEIEVRDIAHERWLENSLFDENNELKKKIRINKIAIKITFRRPSKVLYKIMKNHLRSNGVDEDTAEAYKYKDINFKLHLLLLENVQLRYDLIDIQLKYNL